MKTFLVYEKEISTLQDASSMYFEIRKLLSYLSLSNINTREEFIRYRSNYKMRSIDEVVRESHELNNYIDRERTEDKMSGVYEKENENIHLREMKIKYNANHPFVTEESMLEYINVSKAWTETKRDRKRKLELAKNTLESFKETTKESVVFRDIEKLYYALEVYGVEIPQLPKEFEFFCVGSDDYKLLQYVIALHNMLQRDRERLTAMFSMIAELTDEGLDKIMISHEDMNVIAHSCGAYVLSVKNKGVNHNERNK